MKLTPEEWAEKYGIQIPTVTDAEPDPPPAKELTNPNRKENEFMLNLIILGHSLTVNSEACKARAKRAGKWTWRNIRLLLALVGKVQEDMLNTMPLRRSMYYYQYAVNGHYELVINGPKRQNRYILVSDKHLAALCEATMENECVMCMREGSDIANCPFRQALLEVAPPSEPQEGRWERCEYRDAASSLIRQEEITL